VNGQNAIAALIHDHLGETLVKVFRGGVGNDLFNINVNKDDSLLGQLTGPGDGPPRISLQFGLDVLGTAVSPLLDALPTPAGGPFAFLKEPDLKALVNRVHNVLEGRLGLFEDQRQAIANLIAAQGPAGLREAADGLFAGVLGVFEGDKAAGESVSRLRQLLGRDVGIALPFATILNALQRAGQNGADIPRSVESALLAYFFKADGFRTVDRENIVAPVHVSDVKEAVVDAIEHKDLAGIQFRGLFSKTTAERYLRDTIRIIVESAYDAGRGLKGPGGRFGVVVSGLRDRGTPAKPADAIETQFVTWCKGFASMAESAAMRAVEVGTQGVSEFQTNPLIAAAAGSFAGTVARKLAQDSFLAVLSTDLAGPVKKPGGGTK
jgi:hypothetical protein